MFLMWLGEQITSRGIGNGVSLIIMAGHCRQAADRTRAIVRRRPYGSMDPFVIFVIVALGIRPRSSSSASWSGRSDGS
jgi:preprotein translocase subunit SecY